MTRRAVFLDRDGVLVEEVYYPHTGEREAPLIADDVRLLPGVASALRRFANAGFALVVISNQGGYAKGKTTLRALWQAHERFLALLVEQGVRLDGCYYSYSHPDGTIPYFSGPSLERKPGPYYVLLAAAQLDLDCCGSWMVGDRETDVSCAIAAGVRPVLIANHNLSLYYQEKCLRAPDLPRTVDLILRAESAPWYSRVP